MGYSYHSGGGGGGRALLSSQEKQAVSPGRLTLTSLSPTSPPAIPSEAPFAFHPPSGDCITALVTDPTDPVCGQVRRTGHSLRLKGVWAVLFQNLTFLPLSSFLHVPHSIPPPPMGAGSSTDCPVVPNTLSWVHPTHTHIFLLYVVVWNSPFLTPRPLVHSPLPWAGVCGRYIALRSTSVLGKVDWYPREGLFTWRLRKDLGVGLKSSMMTPSLVPGAPDFILHPVWSMGPTMAYRRRVYGESQGLLVFVSLLLIVHNPGFQNLPSYQAQNWGSLEGGDRVEARLGVTPLLCPAGAQSERPQGLQGQSHVDHYGRYFGEWAAHNHLALSALWLLLRACTHVSV